MVLFRGTFSKKSTAVTGRKPFGKDALLKYDYDSEAEWEEEDEEDGTYVCLYVYFIPILIDVVVRDLCVYYVV